MLSNTVSANQGAVDYRLGFDVREHARKSLLPAVDADFCLFFVRSNAGPQSRLMFK